MATAFIIIPMAAFIAISNPATYKTVRSLAGNWVSSADGLPTTAGLVLHSIVFVMLVSFLMKLFAPRKSGYALSMAPLDDDANPMAAADFDDGPTPAPAPAPAPAEDMIQSLIDKFKY
jgi:hypothetical protein